MSLANGRKPGQINREYTCRPATTNEQCPVKFTIFCDIKTQPWFLSSPKKLNSLGNQECQCLCTHNHLRMDPADLCTETKDLSEQLQNDTK